MTLCRGAFRRWRSGFPATLLASLPLPGGATNQGHAAVKVHLAGFPMNVGLRSFSVPGRRVRAATGLDSNDPAPAGRHRAPGALQSTGIRSASSGTLVPQLRLGQHLNLGFRRLMVLNCLLVRPSCPARLIRGETEADIGCPRPIETACQAKSIAACKSERGLHARKSRRTHLVEPTQLPEAAKMPAFVDAAAIGAQMHPPARW